MKSLIRSSYGLQLSVHLPVCLAMACSYLPIYLSEAPTYLCLLREQVCACVSNLCMYGHMYMYEHAYTYTYMCIHAYMHTSMLLLILVVYIQDTSLDGRSKHEQAHLHTCGAQVDAEGDGRPGQAVCMHVYARRNSFGCFYSFLQGLKSVD